MSDRHTPQARDRRVALPDGRRLGVAEYGDPRGHPVLYFHGFPGSRLEAALIHGAAAEHGLRIIAVDRPGYGLSDPQPGRRLLDWPSDVIALADALGIARFGVLGVSGGGPYVLACAYAVPDRLTAAMTVCGLGPLVVPEVAHDMVWPARLGMVLRRRMRRVFQWAYGGSVAVLMRLRPQWLLRLITLAAPAADRAVLQRADVRRTVQASIREAGRQGRRGVLRDFAIYTAEWGFALEKIPMTVHVWQGEADHTVPPAHARFLAQHIPGARLRMVPGEGHFSLPIGHVDGVLARLVSEGRGVRREATSL